MLVCVAHIEIRAELFVRQVNLGSCCRMEACFDMHIRICSRTFCKSSAAVVRKSRNVRISATISEDSCVVPRLLSWLQAVLFPDGGVRFLQNLLCCNCAFSTSC